MANIQLSYFKKINSSSLFKNGVWLYILQFFQMIMPFITLPYVTRILGVEQYGGFSIALNIIMYFSVVVEYGFNLSGTRKIALADREDYDNIYSGIMLAKGFLCAMSFIALSFLLYFFNYTLNQKKYMGILFLMVIGSAIQQTWLFQGLQKMKFITISTVIARVFSVIAIFVFVRAESDIGLYCLLYSSTHIISGILSAIITKTQFNISFRIVSLSNIIFELREGFSLFLTSAMAKIMTGVGVTILGVFASEHDVGIYSAMQKIPYILTFSFGPIGQVLYPYVSKQFEISYKKGTATVKKALIGVSGIFGITCVVIIMNAKFIIKLVFGQDYLSSINLIYPLTIWALVSIINNILGIQGLVASGHNKKYTQAFSISSFAVLIFNLVLGIRYTIFGVAYAALISEIVLTFGILYQLKKVRNTLSSD